MPERDPYPGRVPRRGAWPPTVLAAGWLFLHVGLALAMRGHPMVATGHALLTYVVGLAVVASSRPQRVVHVAAYIVGAEVLWRMTGAAVFWEFGKYATASLFLLAACRIPSRGRGLLLPALYFALLLPSIWMTISTLDPSVGVGEISFNLSGPFLLAVSCVLFANLPPGSVNLRLTAAALLGPIAGIATLTSYALLSTQIVFGRNSNLESSGGFGPNQVSSALGLGAVAAIAVAIAARSRLRVRVSMLGFGLILISLSALTFSRGGLYTALAACFLGGLALAADRRARLRLLVASALFVGFAGYWILPKLMSYTQGALGARLASTDPTGRDQLLRGDLKAWQEHPLLGTGPGGSLRYHDRSVTTHTEYSRLLAEHGVFGLAALGVLGLLCVDGFRRARSRERRAIVLALFTWSLLFMMHAAMRVAAPAFLFGMAFFFGTDATVKRRAPRPLLDRTSSRLAARTRPV